MISLQCYPLSRLRRGQQVPQQRVISSLQYCTFMAPNINIINYPPISNQLLNSDLHRFHFTFYTYFSSLNSDFDRIGWMILIFTNLKKKLFSFESTCDMDQALALKAIRCIHVRIFSSLILNIDRVIFRHMQVCSTKNCANSRCRSGQKCTPGS